VTVATARKASHPLAQTMVDLAALLHQTGMGPEQSMQAIVDGYAAMHPGSAFNRDQLRVLAAGCGYDAVPLLEAIPAEMVPAEISGPWYEIQSANAAFREVREFLSE